MTLLNIHIKVGAVVSAYNVGENICDVLLKIRRYIPKQYIYVVDDGSIDETARIARDQGVRVIQHRMNRGKGEALKSGFRQALNDRLDVVLTLDGDGQHEADRIPDFVRTMVTTESDLIIGVRRFRIGEMPIHRVCSNRLSSLLVSIAVGKWIPDSQNGYRLIRSSVLRDIRLGTSCYETETEMLIKALWKGYRIAYCPIAVNYGDSSSHIRRVRDTQRFCCLLINLLKQRYF